jgi:hypothetical protein
MVDPTWFPYRRTTLKGVDYIKGEVTLDELHAQVLDSLDKLKIFTGSVECRPVLEDWRVRVEKCRNGLLSPELLKAWIKKQPIWFPEPGNDAGS